MLIAPDPEVEILPVKELEPEIVFVPERVKSPANVVVASKSVPS
jgi:hypothetical protein